MNRLSTEKAAYLRHAAHQKIDWYPWSDEAFQRAKEEDKPVFLSSGAIWCHWCHVMAKESFEDEEVVRLLNEHCINIKLDRDERPDVDRVYQQAVAAMGSGGGWPLSVFLTPDGKPFFGGTYFPPEDMAGRPGFKKVIQTVVDFYRTKKGEIAEYTQRLSEFLVPKERPGEDIEKSSITSAVSAILSEFDPQHGGFGTAPKFPVPGAIEFLMNRFAIFREESTGYAVRRTLEGMAKGGFHDHLGGGFHRYSVDEAWIVPHFEKMTEDNAWLLKNYSAAYGLFRDDFFKEVALGIIGFVRNVLSDPEGGFYASQDADVTPMDEGGYFTWTDDDLRRVLSDQEYPVLSSHFFHDRGSMHHDRSKKVLFISREPTEIAGTMHMDIETVIRIIKAGKEKLLTERERRKAPFLDRTLYTSFNGMMISAYFNAYKVFRNDFLKVFGIKSLERIKNIRLIQGDLFHSDGVPGHLDDYIHTIDAFIGAYEITGDAQHLRHAHELMDLCIAKFWDRSGGFYDMGNEVIGIRLKGMEDLPHPSANSLAIILLLKLFSMTGREHYGNLAEMALKAFSPRAKDIGVHAGYYYSALDAYFHMLTLTLEGSPLSKFQEIALASPYPYVSVVYGEDKGRVVPCLKNRCYEPLYTSESLKDFLFTFSPDR